RHENQQQLALPRVRENQEIEQQHGAAKQRKHQRRDDREVIGGRVELAQIHRTTPADAGAITTWALTPGPWALKYPGRTRSTISATGCRMISKYGLGYTPIHTDHAISGTKMATSRKVMSGIVRFLPLVTCPSMVRSYNHNRY